MVCNVQLITRESGMYFNNTIESTQHIHLNRLHLYVTWCHGGKMSICHSPYVTVLHQKMTELQPDVHRGPHLWLL